MAIARYKTFADGEILTAADMNGVQDMVVTNDQDVGNPRTESFDMDGERLILSEDGNTSMISSTAGKVDFRLNSADVIDLDGTAASPVNGFTIIAAATGQKPTLRAKGSDTNISIGIAAKGTGTIAFSTNNFDLFGLLPGAGTPVNGVHVTAAATGVPPVISAQGSDTNVGLRLLPKGTGSILLDADPTGTGVDIDGAPLVLDADGDSSIRETSDDVIAMRLQGFDAFIFDGDVASPVNGLTFATQFTTGGPQILSHGSDTNINLRLTPKGTGSAVSVNGWAVDGATQLTWRWVGSGTSLLLQENTGTPTVPVWATRTTVATGSTIAGPTLISTHAPTGATLDIDLSGFSKYVIQGYFFPATDSVTLYARTKNGITGGGIAELGASDYGWHFTENSGAGSLNAVGDLADSEIEICSSNVGNSSGPPAEGISITVEVDPAGTVKRLTWDGGYLDTAGEHRSVNGSGVRLGNSNALTGVQFLWEGGGNFAAGSTARVWGWV